jgi:hypothetical protein
VVDARRRRGAGFVATAIEQIRDDRRRKPGHSEVIPA